MSKNRIVSVDFDGTCVTHEYPAVGRDIGAQEVLRELVSHGNMIILHTMRSGPHLLDAVNWFNENGIKLYGVNCNPDQHSWTSSPKPYAHVYIDDAALGCPLKHDSANHEVRQFCDWELIKNQLDRMGYFDN